MFRILPVTLACAVTSAFAAGFGGVGIDGVPQSDGRILVRQVVIGGPAQLADVRGGDIITHIDGKATAGADFKQLVQQRLRGPADTPVVLQIARKGTDKPLVFRLVRRELIPPQKEK